MKQSVLRKFNISRRCFPLWCFAFVLHHAKAASKCEKQGRHSEAQLHQQVIKAYERRADKSEKLARGIFNQPLCKGNELREVVKYWVVASR